MDIRPGVALYSWLRRQLWTFVTPYWPKGCSLGRSSEFSKCRERHKRKHEALSGGNHAHSSLRPFSSEDTFFCWLGAC